MVKKDTVLDPFSNAVHDIPDNTVSEGDYKEKLLSLIYDTTNINVKTDLNQEQVMAVARLELYADYHNIPILKAFTQNFKELQISKDREGRKEATQILAATQSTFGMEEEKNLFDKLVSGK